MFWNRKKTIKPTVLAQSLYDELVCETSYHERVGIHVEPAIMRDFQSKVKTYQFAAVLVALLIQEQSDPKFQKVRVHFEAIFFPVSGLSPAAQWLLGEVRKAMKELVGLSRPIEEAKPLTWARTWLQEAGIEEYNPAKLTMFVIGWKNFLEAAIKSLQEFDPVA